MKTLQLMRDSAMAVVAALGFIFMMMACSVSESLPVSQWVVITVLCFAAGLGCFLSIAWYIRRKNNR